MESQLNRYNSRRSFYQPKVAIFVGSLVVVTLGVLTSLIQFSYAALVNPSSPPPGGQTAIPLSGSDVWQQKLGSIILGGQTNPTCVAGGSRTGCSSLCLNTNTVGTDPTTCITAWGDVTGLSNLSLLKLNTTTFSSGGSFPTAQSGYSYLSGLPNDAVHPTIKLTVPAGISPLTALYAEGKSIDNFAGYFNGDIKIETSGSNTGRLCLNGTANQNDGSAEAIAGHYCITSWTQLSSNIVNKLNLQTVIPTTLELGHVGMSQAFNSGSTILGDPSYIDRNYKCGDGMCDGNATGVYQETTGNCAIDCSTVLPLVGFTATVQSTPTVDLSLTLNGSPAAILVVRTSNVNFNFVPQDGAVYTAGGNTSFAVVYSGAPVTLIHDTQYGMVDNVTYYYRAYQANAFPRFSAANSSTAVVSINSGSGGGGGGTDGGGDQIPEVVRH